MSKEKKNPRVLENPRVIHYEQKYKNSLTLKCYPCF